MHDRSLFFNPYIACLFILLILLICLDYGPKMAFPMNHEALLSHALAAPGLQTCLALPAALGLDKPAIIPTYSEVLSTVVNGTES